MVCAAGFHQVRPLLHVKSLMRKHLLQNHPGSDIIWGVLARGAVALQFHAGVLQALKDIRPGSAAFSEAATELCPMAVRSLDSDYLMHHGETGRAIRAALGGMRGSPVARIGGGKGGSKGWGQTGETAPGASRSGASAGAPCRYFATTGTGTCPWGASCTYYHGGGGAPPSPPLLTQPGLPPPMLPSPRPPPQSIGGTPPWATPSQICWGFIKGSCFRGAWCKYKQ